MSSDAHIVLDVLVSSKSPALGCLNRVGLAVCHTALQYHPSSEQASTAGVKSLVWSRLLQGAYRATHLSHLE